MQEPERPTRKMSVHPWRRRLAIGGVMVAAMLAGGAFALLISERDDARPLAAEASPTPTPTVQTPSPTASPSASPGPSLTPAPTSEPTATSAPASETGAWIGPERISTRAYGELSLVVDDAGIAHAAAELNHAIYYLTNASGSWTREPLSSPIGGGHDGEPAIAIDDAGSLVVAFVRYRALEEYVDSVELHPADPEGVYVVTNASGSWSEPARVPMSTETYSRGLAVAVRLGTVHVAYGADVGGESVVWYAAARSGSWSVQRVNREGGWAGEPSLAVAADGSVRIAFSMEGDVHYAAEASQQGSFAVERLDEGWGPLLAIDGNDRPHLVYGDIHRSWRDGAWTPPASTLPEPDAALGYTAMAVSELGTVHLVSRNDTIFSGLWYATSRGGRFETRQLRPPDEQWCEVPTLVDCENRSIEGIIGLGWELPAALAVDRLGRPHVLFVADGLDEQGRRSLLIRELWYAIGPGD